MSVGRKWLIGLVVFATTGAMPSAGSVQTGVTAVAAQEPPKPPKTERPSKEKKEPRTTGEPKLKRRKPPPPGLD